MLDMPALRQLVERQQYHPLFVAVSGAHLYGFPSPDSDVDLRGAHLRYRCATSSAWTCPS
jgi:predicted nucleotidyltransferase